MSATAIEGPAVRIDTRLPWLESAQQQLCAAIDSHRLTHALLLQGSSGIGADWFVRWLQARLLCESSTSRPCGTCRSCRWVEFGEHPDTLRIGLEDEHQEILIDQIRKLGEELAMTSHAGGWRIACVTPAERLNRHAANALLKTLEEPPPRSLILLVTDAPSRVPATLLSRCQRLVLKAPSVPQCLQWLSSQAPGRDWADAVAVLGPRPFDLVQQDPVRLVALRREIEQTLAELDPTVLDPPGTAERWKAADLFALRLRLIENWLTMQIRAHYREAERGVGLRLGAQLRTGARPLNMTRAFELLDALAEAKRTIDTPINRALTMERLLWGASSLRRA